VNGGDVGETRGEEMAARVKRSRRSHRVQTREPASRLDFESRRRKILMSSSSGISVLIQSWPRIELNRIASKFQCFRFRFCQNERFQVEVASSGRRAEKKSRSNCVRYGLICYRLSLSVGDISPVPFPLPLRFEYFYIYIHTVIDYNKINKFSIYKFDYSWRGRLFSKTTFYF